MTPAVQHTRGDLVLTARLRGAKLARLNHLNDLQLERAGVRLLDHRAAPLW